MTLIFDSEQVDPSELAAPDAPEATTTTHSHAPADARRRSFNWETGKFEPFTEVRFVDRREDRGVY